MLGSCDAGSSASYYPTAQRGFKIIVLTQALLISVVVAVTEELFILLDEPLPKELGLSLKLR